MLPCLIVTWFLLLDLCWIDYFKLISYWLDLIASRPFWNHLIKSPLEIDLQYFPHHYRFLFPFLYFSSLVAFSYCLNDAISNILILATFKKICTCLGGCQALSWLQETFICYWFAHSHTNHPPMSLSTCLLPSVYLGINWTSKHLWPFSASYTTESIEKLEFQKIVFLNGTG